MNRCPEVLGVTKPFPPPSTPVQVISGLAPGWQLQAAHPSPVVRGMRSQDKQRQPCRERRAASEEALPTQRAALRKQGAQDNLFSQVTFPCCLPASAAATGARLCPTGIAAQRPSLPSFPPAVFPCYFSTPVSDGRLVYQLFDVHCGTREREPAVRTEESERGRRRFRVGRVHKPSAPAAWPLLRAWPWRQLPQRRPSWRGRLQRWQPGPGKAVGPREPARPQRTPCSC